MDKYFEIIKNLGANSVKIIKPETIVTAAWTIYKCQYGCGRYGKSFCCPPKSPDYKRTREIIECYETAILFRTHDMTRVSDISVKVAKELFLDGFYKVIAFGSGPCKICNKCNDEYCNFPEKAIPSMEACGIDVFETVKNNGYEIYTLKSDEDVQNHFGLLLVK